MMNKRKSRVCYFGTYSMEEGYPRNRVIIEGLRKNGVEVAECHEDFWKDTSQKLEGVKAGSGIVKTLYRLMLVYSVLISKFRHVGYYDALIVGYAGHIDIFLAKTLNIFRRKPVIFDAFLSLYDTAVMDRRIVRPGSLKAKLLSLIDTWSCRLADAVLLDTQSHVDYFVSEFHLPAGKFHVVPVGSYLQIPLNPSLPKGEINFPPFTKGGLGGFDRGFSVLYFGAYIPLHGVEVILKAAKILQENKDNPSTFTKNYENTDCHLVCHPEFISGSQTMPGEEIPKQVRDDRGAVSSSGCEIVFTLVGTGQLLPAMKELASSLGLKNVIFVERFVSEEELVGYIQQADICLGIFGQTDKAGRVIPCKVYNCLALGKPVITMSSLATEGVLIHRENAILCKPGDPAALAEAVLSLKNDEILRKKIAHNGQEYFDKNYSADAIGKTVLHLIESL